MGFFNFNKKKKFVSKLSIDQQDEILITLILMKQMINADGIEKPEEKEYLKNYLLNCGITSKEELESILDSAAKLTSEQYDLIVSEFDEFQKLTILQELYEIICSDNEINHDEVVLLFRISRDMGIDDDLVVDKFGANKDLLEKYIKTNKVSDSISKKFEDYQNQAKTDLEDIKSKIQEARDIRQKLIDNKLTIRITYGGLWEAEFQFNEAFKNYGESSEFQKHSMIYNKETEPFDYSDLENSDIKAFNKSFSNNKNLKTYSGEIEICEVLKIPKENIIMMLDEYISNPNDEISYEYTSWEDFLTQDWDYPEFSDTDIDDCTLGYNGPRIADCLLGLKQGFAGGNVFHYIQKVWENEKEDKIELKELNHQEKIESITKEAEAIIEKLKKNELEIKVSQGESLHCGFQFNEEFKKYAELKSFKEHSIFGKTEPFDYSQNSDIEKYVANPELYSSLETLSGRLELWQVFKVSKEEFIEHINHFIESIKEDYEYYEQYESVKDYLEGGIDWMGIYGSLPYSEHTLGEDGPKLKDCFIGFLFEENKGYEPKIEFIDMSNERINHRLNDLKDIDNILDFTDVRKLIIQLKENKTPIKLRSIWRNFFYFQFKSDEIDEFKNESDVPALDYYTERYGSAEHYDKNKSLHANWISYIEEIEIDYNEFLKRSFIEDYIESCEKNINVDNYYSTELNFSFEDYINWTTEEDLFFDGVAPGWLKSPKKDLIAPPKHNEDDLTKIYELNYKYFDEVISFCYTEVDIKDQSHVFVFDEGKFRNNEIIVSSNKKLRDELNKFNRTEIKSFSVDILFDKWTFFEEINYVGNFKGFDFTLNGGTAIKWSKHKGCYKNELDDFLKDIKNKEISELDFHSLNYNCDDSDEDYDYNFYNKIIWDENTPEEIIKDVEKNFSENEYEKLRDEIELEEDYLEIELLQKKGFINQIDINFSFENETMNLKWIKKEDD